MRKGCAHIHMTQPFLKDSKLSQIEQLAKLVESQAVQTIHRCFKYGPKEHVLFIFTLNLDYMLAFVFRFSYL